MSQTKSSYIRDMQAQRLYELYKLMRRQSQYSSLCDITRTLELMPMPLHYISSDMASRIYYQYFVHHKPVEFKSISRNIMYNSFLLKCKELMQQGFTDVHTIIQKAVLSEAPCIGLSESQIRRILRSKGAK